MLAVAAFFYISSSSAQMRMIYQDADQTTANYLCKLSFYSPAQGFVAFSNWIGFTTDSGNNIVYFYNKYLTKIQTST